MAVAGQDACAQGQAILAGESDGSEEEERTEAPAELTEPAEPAKAVKSVKPAKAAKGKRPAPTEADSLETKAAGWGRTPELKQLVRNSSVGKRRKGLTESLKVLKKQFETEYKGMSDEIDNLGDSAVEK